MSTRHLSERPNGTGTSNPAETDPAPGPATSPVPSHRIAPAPRAKPSPSPAAIPGHVYLTGSGPGDPALLTLRALRLLETADVILPDDLVSDDILSLAHSAATIIPVGKRCGQPRITQAGIHALMLEHARPHPSRPALSVLRLKSGDPLIFGRAGEEIAFLREHNIPFEIVSGITAAFAAAAILRTPLTDRTSASKLILATAHHAAGKPDLTPSWQGAFPDESTLVLYMPGRDLATLASSLIDSGIPPETPCTAISKISTIHQQITVTNLADLPHSAVGPAPVLLLIGHAIQPILSTD